MNERCLLGLFKQVLALEFLQVSSNITEIINNKLFERVHPCLVMKDSYIANINGVMNAVILKGMPVLDKEYLVGRVVETNYLSSRVLLLNDLNSRIPVIFGKEGVQAILKGTGGSKPSLEYLPEGYIIQEGIDVFTSGKDRIFLPGSPIGITTEKGEVKLFSESSQLSFVKVDLSKQRKEAF